MKLDSFFVGLKLDSFYDYSSDCIDSIVFTLDDKAYLSNNRTTYRAANESWIHPILNFTLLLGTNFADTLPNCYEFLASVKEVEVARYDSYEGVGDILIAFLFN